MRKGLKAAWKPAVFFLFCLVIAILINMPISLLLAQVKVPGNIRISGLQGTPLNGHASELLVNRFSIRQLEYRADFSCLLEARLCYRLKFEDGTAMLRFEPISKTIEITGLDADIPMQKLSVLSNQLLVSPSGSLRLNIDKLAIRQGKLVDISAFAIWQDAGIIGEDFNLGDYRLEVEKGIDQYRFTLKDNDGILEIDGKGILASDGKYSLNINIRARPGLDSQVKNVLELIARKKGLNQYLIHHTGQLDGRWAGLMADSGSDL